MDDASGWVRSSYSNAHGGACVEVRHDFGTIMVRDSKSQQPGQAVIRVPSEGWAHFLKTITRQ